MVACALVRVSSQCPYWQHMRLLLVMLFISTAVQCRSAAKSGAGEIEGAELSIPWYDQDGNISTCEQPRTSCPATGLTKKFVDACVAGGSRAKACGCQALCSSKMAGFGTMALADGNTAKTADGGTSGTCSGVQLDQIKQILNKNVPGASLDRCLKSYVCSGDLGWCTATGQQLGHTLRLLAVRGCQDAVLGSFCKDGYVGGLTCADPTDYLLKPSR